MKLVLRTGKKGMGTELFIVIILGLVFTVLTLNAAGKLQAAAEEKDYGDTMCRAALASEDTLFNNSMEQSLKVATSGVIGVAAGWQAAKITGQVVSMVAQMFIGVGEAGAGVKGWQLGGSVTKAMGTLDKAEDVLQAEKGITGAFKGATQVKEITFDVKNVMMAEKPVFVNGIQLKPGQQLIEAVGSDGSKIFQVVDKEAQTIKVYRGYRSAEVITTKSSAMDVATHARQYRGYVAMKKWGYALSKWKPRMELTAFTIVTYMVYGRTQTAINMAEATAQSGLTNSCGLYIKDTQVGYTQEMAALITNFTAYACDMGQFEEKSTATMVRLAGGVLTNDTNKVTFEMIQALYHGSENDYYHQIGNENDSKYLNSCALIWRVGGTPVHCNDINTISVTDADELELSTGANITSEAAIPLKISYCHRKKLLPGTEHFVEITDYRE